MQALSTHHHYHCELVFLSTRPFVTENENADWAALISTATTLLLNHPIMQLTANTDMNTMTTTACYDYAMSETWDSSTIMIAKASMNGATVTCPPRLVVLSQSQSQLLLVVLQDPGFLAATDHNPPYLLILLPSAQHPTDILLPQLLLLLPHSSFHMIVLAHTSSTSKNDSTTTTSTYHYYHVTHHIFRLLLLLLVFLYQYHQESSILSAISSFKLCWTTLDFVWWSSQHTCCPPLSYLIAHYNTVQVILQAMTYMATAPIAIEIHSNSYDATVTRPRPPQLEVFQIQELYLPY